MLLDDADAEIDADVDTDCDNDVGVRRCSPLSMSCIDGRIILSRLAANLLIRSESRETSCSRSCCDDVDAGDGRLYVLLLLDVLGLADVLVLEDSMLGGS